MQLSFNCPGGYISYVTALHISEHVLKNFWKQEVSLRENSFLDIELVNGDEIKKVNRDYLYKDKKTDVIAFSFTEGGESSPDDILHLGQILISEEAVREQAADIGHSEEEEFKLLLIHGLLHIAGWEEGEDIQKCQIEILKSLSQII